MPNNGPRDWVVLYMAPNNFSVNQNIYLGF